MSYILEALRRAQAERERGQLPGLGTQVLLPVASMPAAPRWPLWGWAGGGVALTLALLLGLWWGRGAGLESRPALPATPATGLAAPAASSAALSAAPAPQETEPLAARAENLVVVSVPPAGLAPSAAYAASASSAPVPRAAALPLAQLSPEQRRDWPAFTLGGTVWSESPASRFVIANGEVLREGGSLAPGLVLVRIEPKTLLLRWRGLLVEMPS